MALELVTLPLVIFIQILLVSLRKVVCHRIRPLERHPAFIHLLHGLLHELHLHDPTYYQLEQQRHLH